MAKLLSTEAMMAVLKQVKSDLRLWTETFVHIAKEGENKSMRVEECNECYFNSHSICPVHDAVKVVGDVQITSMFIPNEHSKSGNNEFLHRIPVSDKCDHFRANIKRTPCPALIDKLRIWLGEDGKKFFTEVKEKYGKLTACWSEGGIPHPVHFREGMQVRNFMRDTGLCLDWDAIDYDDNWEEAVEKALGI